MKKAFLAFLFFFTAFIYSNKAAAAFHFTPVYNVNNEDLAKQLKAAKTDTAKLNLLISLTFNNHELVESPEYIDTAYLKQLININERAKLFDDTPFKTLQQALKHQAKSDFTEALSLLKTSIEQFDEQNIEIPMLLIEARWVFNAANQQEEKYKFYSKELSYYLQKGQYHNAAACYHCMAGYFSYKGDLNSCINNYLKAGELFESFSHLWYMHEFNVIAGRYNDWGNTAKSRYYLEKALSVKSASADNDDLFGTYAFLATLEYDLKNYKVSLSYVDKIYTKSPAGLFQNNAITVRALNLVGLNRLQEARSELEKSQSEQNMSSLSRAILNSHYTLDYAFYKYYVATGDYAKAETHLLTTYNKSKTDANLQLQIFYLKELGEFYSNRNSTGKALQYTTLYNHLNDSLQVKMGAFNVASYENQQKENEQNRKLNLLRQQHAVQEATLAQRNTIILLSLAGLLVVLGSLVFIYRQLQINKRNLKHLTITQNQLVQSEKMASLGELTAGIAHEIQNPLNFVNNFSEVNIELVEEMELELTKGDKDEAIAIAADIKQNLEKIRHHGNRADGIVKGMLQHSRASSNQKEPANLNALADEYLRLAYHGLRAKDKSFNADLVTHFDEKLPLISMVPQDIGRVILNIINNAFYATQQKAKIADADYKPQVAVTTELRNSHAVIKIKDNGTGIPDSVREKIMQPFYTTKPTGEGTGLGLSLSYDIVVKGHGGNINVESKEGEGSEFTITLPIG